MRCKHCDSEWQSPRTVQVMFCPFCHNPLISVDNNFHKLQDVLLFLTKEYGLDILRNKQSILQFIECFFPEGEREYKFMNMVYASRLMETLFRIRNSPKAIQVNAVKQVIIQLSDKYGISHEWADYVVGCICNSLGMDNDIEHSIINIKQNAEQGDPKYQFELAECYRNGRNIERNSRKYFIWLERSANNEYPPAMLQMGEELWNGSLRERNEIEAIHLLQKAALFGNRDAVCMIAGNEEIFTKCDIDLDAFIQDLIGVKIELTANQLLGLSRYLVRLKDISTAIEIARLAYEKDEKKAWEDYIKALQLSKTHESEFLVLKVLRETATNGNTAACNRLGKQYEEHASTESDMKTALYWYRMAAETGDRDAQLHLADIYEHGYIVQQDMESAVYWYRIAAYNGSDFARGKVSYKSKDCINNTITLVFDDDSELICKVEKTVSYQGEDYLIISDPDTQERIVALYLENRTLEGFEIKSVDQDTEDEILRIYGGEVR